MLSRLLLIAIVCVAATACEPREELETGPVVHTPLRVDPTEELEVAAWWVSDDHLLFDVG